MLVLARKKGERILIGDGITVVINQISGNRVVMGIDAPCQMNIQRCNMKSKAQPLRRLEYPR